MILQIALARSDDDLRAAILLHLCDDAAIDAVGHTRQEREQLLLRQCTRVGQDAERTPYAVLHALLTEVGECLAGAPLMRNYLPYHRLEVLDHLRLRVAKRQLVGDLIEMRSLADALEQVNCKP